MILDSDFAILIGHDGTGPVVTVTHKQTERQRTERPTALDSVAAVKNRLVAGLRAEFCDPDEFMAEIGCCEVEGQRRDFCRIVHLPTGRRRTATTAETGDRSAGALREMLLDQIVAELYREGYRPRQARQTAEGTNGEAE